MSEEDVPILQCNRCGASMKLVRTTPKFGAVPELQTFRCETCGHVDTIETDDN